MSFPASPRFTPQVSKVPVFGGSSGNSQDPKSVATTALAIQAMTDQAKADTLYDPPAPKPEGFRGTIHSNMDALVLIVIGSILIMRSFYMKR